VITVTPDPPPLSEPEPLTGERHALRQWLDFHRSVLLRKATGVTEDDARLTLTPGGVSLIGLVRHLTEVERNWFQRGFRGDASVEPLYYSDADPDGDFHPGPQDTLAEALATYTATCEQSRAIESAAASLDELAERVHPEMGRFNLRWIILHMIEETARHNGHADFLRETIDGSTGD
jgi:hypothetical protein